MKATMIDHRKIVDLQRMWEEKIHKQGKDFDTIAKQVCQYDTEMNANTAQIRQMKYEHEVLKNKAELADQSINQIYEQQDALGRMLLQLQEALKLKIPEATAQPLRTHQRAKVLTVQLDELDRQVEDLAKETQTVQSTLYVEPLTTVVRVLDSHASALDAIQAQVGAVTQRLEMVESTF